MSKRRFMRIWATGFIILTLCLLMAPVALSQSPGPGLKVVFIDGLSVGEVQKLAMGIDIAAVRKGPVVTGDRDVEYQTYRVEAVVSSRDVQKLDSTGFDWSDVPGKGPEKKTGQTYQVYHSFDEPITGIKAQLHKIAATYPQLAQLKTFGYSLRDAHAGLKLTNEKAGRANPRFCSWLRTMRANG
jgi:hypothetical protein